MYSADSQARVMFSSLSTTETVANRYLQIATQTSAIWSIWITIYFLNNTIPDNVLIKPFVFPTKYLVIYHIVFLIYIIISIHIQTYSTVFQFSNYINQAI